MVSIDVAVDADAASGCSEVVQCYVRDPPTRHVRRWQRLVGFQRVKLHGGAERRRTVRIELKSSALAVLDDAGHWRVLPGEYAVACGASSIGPNTLEATMNLLYI